MLRSTCSVLCETADMGRPKRADAAGHCYHMLNRANLRATIFHKPADFEAFEKILDEALDQYEIDLFAYCLMVK